MKITYSSKIQRLILAVALSIAPGFVSPVSAQVSSYILDTNSQQLIDLGTLGGSITYARAINDAGQVVGRSFTATSSEHAFITGPNGVGMTDLGPHSVSDINDAGQVVGWFTPFPGSTTAFITGPNGMGMTDLGTLGGSYSRAWSINDAGQVVGISSIATGEEHAFITGPNGTGMIDLNSLVELPAGIYLENALDINNAGQVIVTPISVIPEPQSYALMLAGLMLVGFMVRRKSLPA